MRSVHILLLAGSIALGQRPVAPIPADPHELVTGEVQVPATPGDRAAIFSLLERGKQNSDMHMPGSAPFLIKMSFNAAGAVAHTGTGEISETWLSGRSWRYEQTMGDYSEVRIGVRGQTYEKKVNEVPLRVQMLRNAMFWPVGGNPSNSSLRSAAAQWDGKPVTCVLLGNGEQANAPGRRWEETEYCVDNASGLLKIYSRAPGSYAVYAYGQDVQFHGRQVPDQITMYMGGAEVMQAHLSSITDAADVDQSLLTPGPDMVQAPTNAMNMRFPMAAQNPEGHKMIQPVIVHAMIGRDGNVVEQELAAASDPALGESAIELVKKANFMKSAQLRTAYINVRFQ
jgi:hypothetical protein